MESAKKRIYTKTDRILYYIKRVDDENLTFGQREYAKKRLKDLRSN